MSCLIVIVFGSQHDTITRMEMIITWLSAQGIRQIRVILFFLAGELDAFRPEENVFPEMCTENCLPLLGKALTE